jgi:hypothetical protein
MEMRRPDMFVLGFQEIVPLTAQQILQTDPEKRYDMNSCEVWTHRCIALSGNGRFSIPSKNVQTRETTM